MRPGKNVQNNPKPIEASLKPVDLRHLLATGKVRLQSPRGGGLENVFDGDPTSLFRSDNVNPVVLTFTFQEPISLKAVRIFPSYSAYDWALYPEPNKLGMVIRGAGEEDWSRIDLPKAVKTNTVRVEVLRIVRDNYVHLNEVEFYTE